MEENTLRQQTTVVQKTVKRSRIHKYAFFHELIKNRVLFLMALPGILLLFGFNYLPLFGLIIAFKNMNFAKGFFRSDWYGFKNGCQNRKIHPCEKPTELYKWLLTNYAKEGDKILDTHVGSGSSIIACIDMGFEYMGFEIDEGYYKAMQERIYHFTRQTVLI